MGISGKPYKSFRTLWVGAVRLQGYEPQKSNTGHRKPGEKGKTHRRKFKKFSGDRAGVADFVERVLTIPHDLLEVATLHS